MWQFYGFPGGASGKEPTCQYMRCKRHRYDPWAGKIPWRSVCHPTPVFLSGESYGQRRLEGYSPQVCKRLHTLKQVSMWQFYLFIYFLEEHSLFFIEALPISYCSYCSVGAQYATGDQWRNNSRRKEGMDGAKAKAIPCCRCDW